MLATNSPGVVTYSSSNPNVATVNSTTGAVTIVGVGTTTITGNQAAYGNYTTASANYGITVNAPVVVDPMPTGSALPDVTINDMA